MIESEDAFCALRSLENCIKDPRLRAVTKKNSKSSTMKQGNIQTKSQETDEKGATQGFTHPKSKTDDTMSLNILLSDETFS